MPDRKACGHLPYQHKGRRYHHGSSLQRFGIRSKSAARRVPLRFETTCVEMSSKSLIVESSVETGLQLSSRVLRNSFFREKSERI